MSAPDTSGARVLVVGDVMLDRYWFGDASRISPEAPVPVVLVQREETRPGGAANVARNCTALGASTQLLSVVGEDEAGARLLELVQAEGVRTNFHRDPSIRTTVKLRVVARQQQLIRVDFETSPSREVLASKLADFQQALPACNVVILSDYGKGGLAHISSMISLAAAATLAAIAASMALFSPNGRADSGFITPKTRICSSCDILQCARGGGRYHWGGKPK